MCDNTGRIRRQAQQTQDIEPMLVQHIVSGEK